MAPSQFMNVLGPGSRRPVRTVVAVLALAAVIALLTFPAWRFVAAQTKLTRDPGRLVPEFALRDVRTGQLHRLSDHEQHVVVVVFCSTHWPMANTYLPRLSAYAAAGEMRKVDYVAISTGASESADDVVEQARALRVRFPVLFDPRNRVADMLSAEQLGEALVIDGHGRLRYRGAIDDQFGSEPPRGQPGHNYLLDAIDAVIAGKAVSPESTPVPGPPIERVGRSAAQ